MGRNGIRVVDLYSPKVFREKLEINLSEVNYLLEHRYKATGFGVDEIFERYMEYAEKISHHVADTDIIVSDMVRADKKILFEGAQGTLLDVDHGTYPFVTSSSSIAGGACTGLGIGPTKITKVLGVAKAYTTRVGGGPFPTEIHDAVGEALRQKGGEYGATTGRPRRCGWLDLVGLRHALRVNGLTGLAITKLDILDDLEKIRVCVAYRYGGRLHEDIPKEISLFEEAEPVYEEMEGWKQNTIGITTFEKLPRNAQHYVRNMEEKLGVNIDMISTGQRREELIMLNEQF
jgi:adenylosuccinate synthase